MLPVLFCALPLAAQNFIQMSELKPSFVVITGDLINKGGDGVQAAEFKRISAKLDPSIQTR